MKLGTLGYNYSHDSDFVMDRPNGPGSWLMLIIKTPALFELNGKNYSVRANSFVMISPETPCKYRAAGETYTDDWIYFSADEADVRRFAELGIPVNEPVYLGDVEAVSRIVHILAFEHYGSEPFHCEIEEHYGEILLFTVSRMIRSGSHISSKMFIEKNH